MKKKKTFVREENSDKKKLQNQPWVTKTSFVIRYAVCDDFVKANKSILEKKNKKQVKIFSLFTSEKK